MSRMDTATRSAIAKAVAKAIAYRDCGEQAKAEDWAADLADQGAQQMQLDRSALNRALAKAIAHKQAGNQQLANQWAAHMLFLLDTMDIADQAALDSLDASHAPPR